MANSIRHDHDAIQHYLESNGLLLTVLPVAELPDSLVEGVSAIDPEIDTADTLLLFANGGPIFWTQMQLAYSELPATQKPRDPVDSFSQQLVTQFSNTFIGGDYELLYPSQMPIPLIGLGIHAGWSHNSPLGLTLHATYGPWYAFRAVIRVSRSLLSNVFDDYLSQQSSADSSEPSGPPCVSCETEACISNCPAQAISATEPFNVVACFEHRKKHGSICESDCPARRACPVGAEFQYDPEQLGYHMRRSLGRSG